MPAALNLVLKEGIDMLRTIKITSSLTLLLLAVGCDASMDDHLIAEADDTFISPSDEQAVAGEETVAAIRERSCESPDPAEEPPPVVVLSRGLTDPRWRVDEGESMAADDLIFPPTEEELAAALEYSARFAEPGGQTVRSVDRSSPHG